MGVYNCETTLEIAISSILHQTYTYWELIICDDGSTDNTHEIALKIANRDQRIIVLRNESNCGLNKTLNRCFSVSSGDYIARMDGDDDCLPERFEKELLFLKTHPEFGLVSTPMVLFDDSGEWGVTSSIEFPMMEDVVCGSPICHAPVMMRRECMESVGGYTEDPRMLRVEDVNLWIKLYAAGYRCYNLQYPLYRMRNDQDAFKRRKYKYRIHSTYVRLKGCRELNLSALCYIRAFKPMIIGLIPARIRSIVRRKYRKKNKPPVSL